MVKGRVVWICSGGAVMLACLVHLCMFAHMAETVDFHRTLFSAVVAMVPQDSPTHFISPSTVLLHVCLGLPLLLLPAGFHCSDWRVMFWGSFLRVWPIQRHFLALISQSIGFWSVILHNSSLVTHSGQKTPVILLRHLLVKVCSFCLMLTDMPLVI